MERWKEQTSEAHESLSFLMLKPAQWVSRLNSIVAELSPKILIEDRSTRFTRGTLLPAALCSSRRILPFSRPRLRLRPLWPSACSSVPEFLRVLKFRAMLSVVPGLSLQRRLLPPSKPSTAESGSHDGEETLCWRSISCKWWLSRSKNLKGYS